MGLEKKNCTFRLGVDTQAMLADMQKAFWPFCEDLASTLRLAIRIAHTLLFTRLRLEECFPALQLLHRKTLHGDAVQLTFSFPGLEPSR